MPYIVPTQRDDLDPLIGALGANVAGPGQLNYVITSLIDDVYGFHDEYELLDRPPQLGYKELNEIIGVLECVKQEFYRRVVAPYEDKKRNENGDVYPRTLALTRESR